MDVAPVIVACCALLFTVGSFYWLQARKGRLKLYPVITFSGMVNERRIALRMPIIIYNTGARPRVISAIRLRWQGDREFLLECHTFRKTIDPKPEDTEDYAHPYVVPGRSVVTKYAHFMADGFARHLSDKPSIYDVEVMLDDDTAWKVLGPVLLHTEIMNNRSYVTYSNNPGVWPDGILTQAQSFRAELEETRIERAAAAAQAAKKELEVK